MNKNRIIGGITLVVLLGLVLGFWFLWQRPQEAPSSTAISIPPKTSLPSNPSPSTISASVTNQVSPQQAQQTSQAQVQYQNHFFQMLFLTPVVFYGKAVDTAGSPIAGATASISVVDSMGDNNSAYEKKTDDGGLFSISTHGAGLVINVSKEGYYTTEGSGGTFGYVKGGGVTNPHPDPNNPAIFVLRKRGLAEHLIVTQGYIKIARDGTPIQMNLTTGNASNVTNADIVIQAWTQDKDIPRHSHQHYDWRCKITVPGGGLQPRTGGEFDFVAPEDGYQSSDEIDMPANAPKWSPMAAKSYFLQLGNGTYARIDFQMFAENDHFFSITSYLNPTPGHRNLEYDPKQQVNK